MEHLKAEEEAQFPEESALKEEKGGVWHDKKKRRGCSLVELTMLEAEEGAVVFSSLVQLESLY